MHLLSFHGLFLLAAVSAVTVTAAHADPTVYIGGVRGLDKLATPALADPLLATGRIGLYEHAVGIGALDPVTRARLQSTWSVDAGGDKAVAETGAITQSQDGTIGGYFALFGAHGYPDKVVVNFVGDGYGSGTYLAPPGSARPGVTYQRFVSGSDQVTASSAIREARAHGAHVVALNFTPNGPDQDLEDPFATSGYWANARVIFLEGGGLGLDVPPAVFFDRTAPYRRIIGQMIAWGRSNGLEVIMIVSPFSLQDGKGPAGYDGSFANNTRRMVQSLQAQDAIPTRWVVENYAVSTGPVIADENQPSDASDLESLDAVALYLATLPVVR